LAEGVTSDTTDESGVNFGRSEYHEAGMARRGGLADGGADGP
jgi:hypothetical protein